MIRNMLNAAAGVSTGTPPAGTPTIALSIKLNGSTNGYNQSALLSNGNVVVALIRTDYVGFQIFSPAGVLVGLSQYKAPQSNSTCGLAVDESDNIYLGANNFLCKCTTSGTIIWSLTGFPSLGINIGYLSYKSGVLAFTSSPRGTAGGNNSYLFAVDSTTGSVYWSKHLSNGQRTELERCAIDNSGNIYVGGLLGSYNAAVLKFDPTGVLLWQKRYGFDETVLAVDPVNGYSLLGTYNPNKIRVFDASGTCTAGQDLSGSNSYTFVAAYVHSDGSYVISARNTTNVGFSVLKFGPTGSLLWNKSYYFTVIPTAAVAIKYISLDANNNYVLTGTNATPGTTGLYVVMNSSTGVVNAASGTWTENNTTAFTYSNSTTVTASVAAATVAVYTSALTVGGASSLGLAGTPTIYITS